MKRAASNSQKKSKRARKQVDRFSPSRDPPNAAPDEVVGDGEEEEDREQTPPPPPKPKTVAQRVSDMEATLANQQQSIDKVLQILTSQQQDKSPASDKSKVDDAPLNKEEDIQKVMEEVLKGKHNDKGKDEVTTTMGPIVAAIPPAVRKDIWSGDFFDLSRLMEKQVNNKRVTMDVTGENIAVDISSSGPPKYNFKQWKEAFFHYAMCLSFQDPNEAQHLMAYNRRIEKMAAEFGDTAWYLFDIEFRRQKPARNWTWADEAEKVFMEIIAKVLLTKEADKDGNNFRHRQQRQHQQTGTPNRPLSNIQPSSSNTPNARYQALPEDAKLHYSEVPNGFCRRFATAICPNEPDTCKFAHRCFKCFAAHHSITCRAKRPVDTPHRTNSNKGK